MIVHSADPYNAEPPRAALDGHPVTPLDTFYSRNHGPIPRLDPDAWRLEVDGLVERPLTLSLDELRTRFDSRTVVATLACAGNRREELGRVRPLPGQEPWGPGAVSTARWTGVALADVLAAAGLRPEARHVAFTAPDVAPKAQPPQPFGGSIPVAKAMASEVLLAWAMNAAPLPVVHGAPVRVVVPRYIGARSVKWLQRVTAREHPSDNYFQATNYRLLPAGDDAGPGRGLPLGVVAVNAAILRPGDGEPVPAGPTRISGYAFAGEDRDVARVEVSVDGGRHWQQAELDAGAGPWAWRLWRATVDVPAGPVEIVARAWDTSASTQPESAGHVWNPQGYVNNSWPRVHVTGRPG
ncbi:sulfite dehydrogenase (cytochrome) subunit SorA apoprotein [Micromonospora pattaloongensis]|uniref:Sulfite dehydrogenase (Cytochrome) subunit SorA apoprotein n=2 Tax=Micromonospora pattaloongensis TaxID=405436 RepID=A0A1H3JP12_9ACTN|nr:sulfite dehydrogenase (cytochrome) subunit SorA apoprotein [Micromonospora pattaloongensis]